MSGASDETKPVDPTAGVGTNNWWQEHCPDCTHCFAAHNAKCGAIKIKAAQSPSGVAQREECTCVNNASALRLWEARKRKELGIDPDSEVSMFRGYETTRPY